MFQVGATCGTRVRNGLRFKPFCTAHTSQLLYLDSSTSKYPAPFNSYLREQRRVSLHIAPPVYVSSISHKKSVARSNTRSHSIQDLLKIVPLTRINAGLQAIMPKSKILP